MRIRQAARALTNIAALMGGVLLPIPPGTSYFVSPTGSDANDGLTQATAWQTVAKVNATAIPAGYNVLFEGGQTFTGNLVIDAGGSIIKNTIYGSYGYTKAVISAGAGIGVDASDQPYVMVQDLSFVGNGTTNDKTAVLFQNNASDHGKIPGCRVERVNVFGFGRNGIAVFGNETYGDTPVLSGYIGMVIKDCVIDNCTFNYLGASTAGIMIFADAAYGARFNRANGHAAMPYAHQNITVDGCTVKNCPGTAGFNNWNGSGIFIGQTHTAEVIRCGAYSNGSASTNPSGGPGGIWSGDSYGIATRYSVSISNRRAAGLDGGGFNMDGGSVNCVIEYCYTQDNHGGAYMIFAYDDPDYMDPNANCTIRYCFSYNDATNNLASLFIQNDNTNGDFTGCVVHNNVIIQKGVNRTAVTNGGGADADVDILNNIIWAENGSKLINSGTLLTGVRFRGNMYYAPGVTNIITWQGVTYTSVAAWRAASGQETLTGADTSQLGDPLFVSAPASIAVPEGLGYPVTLLAGYKLQAGSVAKTGGSDISALGYTQPATDYFGAATTATAIGASAA